MWREEQIFWNVMFPWYPDKNEKDKKEFEKNVRQISNFFRLIFSNNALF